MAETQKEKLDRIITRDQIINRITGYCINMNGEELMHFYNDMLRFVGVDRPDIKYEGDDFWTEEKP